MKTKPDNIFERHPKKSILAIVFTIAFIVVGLVEIYLRISVSYNIGYYTGIKKEGLIEYPYGNIIINSHLEPDSEFDLKDSRSRVGYVGDSVNYGVGAGYGYRFSDLLEKSFPSYQHMTFGFVSFGIHDVEARVNELDEYDLDTVIYLLNLNDILPKIESDNEFTSPSFLNKTIILLSESVDYFRDKSYFYNYFRTTAKTIIQRMGYGHGGFQSYEFYPKKHSEIFKETASRVNIFAQSLAQQKIRFCVVLLPYEMQISSQAAINYQSMGFKWEDGFSSGSPQKQLLKYLNTDQFEVINSYYAFVNPNDIEIGKQDNKLGQYYVYDKGDKIDWNHPNREGHKKIADYAIKKRFCGLE